jgi:hypothetical protein
VAIFVRNGPMGEQFADLGQLMMSFSRGWKCTWNPSDTAKDVRSRSAW